MPAPNCLAARSALTCSSPLPALCSAPKSAWPQTGTSRRLFFKENLGSAPVIRMAVCKNDSLNPAGNQIFDFPQRLGRAVQIVTGVNENIAVLRGDDAEVGGTVAHKGVYAGGQFVALGRCCGGYVKPGYPPPSGRGGTHDISALRSRRGLNIVSRVKPSGRLTVPLAEQQRMGIPEFFSMPVSFLMASTETEQCSESSLSVPHLPCSSRSIISRRRLTCIFLSPDAFCAGENVRENSHGTGRLFS